MSRPGLVLPDPQDCPSTIAEAVWDVRYLKDTERTRAYLKSYWGTQDYLIQAVKYVYAANEWPLTPRERKTFREIFQGKR